MYSAAWMPLLLGKRSPRQREQRELRELEGGGGLLSAITGEKRVAVLAAAAAAPEITMNVYLGEYECMGRHNRFT